MALEIHSLKFYCRERRVSWTVVSWPRFDPFDAAGCIFTGCRHAAIICGGRSNISFLSNEVRNNIGFGIVVVDESHGEFRNNLVAANRRCGIVCAGMSAAVFENNTVSHAVVYFLLFLFEAFPSEILWIMDFRISDRLFRFGVDHDLEWILSVLQSWCNVMSVRGYIFLWGFLLCAAQICDGKQGGIWLRDASSCRIQKCTIFGNERVGIRESSYLVLLFV